MDILADKVQYLFDTGASNDEIVNFIKNYTVIINESNLSNDFIELEQISRYGCTEEIIENMLDEIGSYAHHYVSKNSLK